MNKYGLWFVLSCKRCLKRPLFLMLLLLLPLILWGLQQAQEHSTDQINIAVFTESDSWNDGVAEELMRKVGSFDFYLCETRQELEQAVMSGEAECGYVFPEKLKEKLDRGSYKRAITVVTAPSTVVDKLASEVVFAGLFRVYARELLKQYSQTGTAFAAVSETDVWGDLAPLYDKYLDNGSTFSFQYETVAGKTMADNSVKAAFPVRGMGALFILVMGLAAAVNVGEDERNGVFRAMHGRRKNLIIAVQISAFVFLACLSAFTGLYVTGSMGNIGSEVVSLALYGVLAAGYSFVLCRILRNPLVVAGIIPFVIIISLAACPIFADLSAFVPVLKIIRLFLPPYYYLL